MSSPLADIIRPNSLDSILGQSHIMDILKSICRQKNIPNMIFYGPPGTGKTTVARIIAQHAEKPIHKLNGTTTSTSDIKAIIDELNTFSGINGVVIYLDEIQYLNKKQQQTLLEFMENGSITLIASTTENPYFYIYNAILSRSTIFEFKPVEKSEIQESLTKAFHLLSPNVEIEDGVEELIASASGGDVRKSLNLVEICFLASQKDSSTSLDVINIQLDIVKRITSTNSMIYDRDGDQHYNLLSAFQKSIRGSDENAALHYLARLLEAGDLVSICRRLLVICCEDIGLAYPQAISVVKSCVDTARELGLPEARIPLSQAVVLLCTSPKSNSAYVAIDTAIADVKSGNFSDVPSHIKDGHYAGAKKLGNGVSYKYPHDYHLGYVSQQYLPDSIADKIYYNFGNNKAEQSAFVYRQKIKHEKD